MKVAAIIPAYNESKTIGEIVREAKKYVDVVFVIDDGSEDDTAKIAQENGAIVIRHKKNKGVGAALRTGYQTVIKMGFDYVVQLDGDGQHDPKYIPTLLEVCKSCDMVIGSRYLNESYRNYSLIRRMGISFFTFIVNLLTSANITDVTSGYRAFKVESLKKICQISDRHWAVEQTLRAAKRGLVIKEMSVEMPVRKVGKSHLNPVRFVLYPFRMIVTILRVMLLE